MDSLDRSLEQLKREFVLFAAQTVRESSFDLTKDLNQAFRRLRQYEGASEWFSALADALRRFAPQVVLFEVKGAELVLRRAKDLELPDDLRIPLASAPAFQSVLESKDPAVVLRTASEVTEPLSSLDGSRRAQIMPILNSGRVVAILFAPDEEATDPNGLELLTGIASAVLERRTNQELHGQIASLSALPVPQAAAPKPPEALPKRPLPKWADLDEKGQLLHFRAQRFSRATVAEMQLSRPEACRAGREKGNLYLFLKNEIESARSQFRQQFMVIPSMVDYLHMELVRTAAEGDEALLGADYPGQLI